MMLSSIPAGGYLDFRIGNDLMTVGVHCIRSIYGTMCD